MKSILGWPSGTAALKFIEIPTTKGTLTPHPVLWPHEFFSELYAHRRPDFDKKIRGPATAALQFWRQMRGSSFVDNHPDLPELLWDRIIPIGLHGDGGQFTKQDSIYVLTWNSLTQNFGPTMDTRIIFTVIRSAEMLPNTLDTLFEAMAWSLNVCLKGLTPSADWQNRPLTGGGRQLAGGYRGACCQIRGDWEFFCKAFHFPKWNEAVSMCPFCRATGRAGHYCFANVRPDAPWRGTIWTHETRMAYLTAAGLILPILLTAILGFRLECVHVDPLHTLELGTTSHVAGNVLWHIAIVKSAFGGTTIAEKIKALNAYLQQWYKDTKCQRRVQGPITPERVRTSGGWPKLKAKAAATKHILLFCIHIMEVFGDFSEADGEDHQILGLCRCLQRFYVLCDVQSRFFSQEAKDEIRVLSQTFASLYARLANTSFAARVRMWKIQPKVHLFQHLAEYMIMYQGNPRFFWTYSDEDMVGNMIEVAHGVHVSCVAVGVLTKWIHTVFS